MIFIADTDLDTVLSEAFRRINEISRRLRTAEERLELIETNISATKDMMVKNHSETSSHIERFSNELKNLEERLLRTENENARLNKAFEKTAKSIEVEELRGTISLLNPLQTKFTTEEDVKKIVREEMEDHHKS